MTVAAKPTATTVVAPKKSPWGLIIVILAVGSLIGLVWAFIHFGYLHPDPARCGQEWLYHKVQSLTNWKAPGTLPVIGGNLFREPGVDGQWTGACIGKPAPWNNQIMLSVGALWVIIMTWLVSVISRGFSARRLRSVPILALFTFLMIPHWANQYLGDRALLFRFVYFTAIALLYAIISKLLLDDPKAMVKATTTPAQQSGTSTRL